MKTRHTIFLLFTTVVVSAQFSENFGSGRSRVLFYANSTYGFQNDLYDQSTSCFVVGPGATNLPQNTLGYEVSNTVGASGGGAIELIDRDDAGSDSEFFIHNINTLASNTISLNAKTNHSFNNKQPLLLAFWNNNTWQSISTFVQGLNVPSNTWRNYTYILPLAAKRSNLVIKITTNDVIRPPGNIGRFYTSIDDVKTDNSLSNDEISFEDFKIYPNPSKLNFIIDLGNNNIQNHLIRIYNLLGQEVYNAIVDKPKFEVTKSWQGVGLFFVKICDNNNKLVITKKIIVQ